MVSKFSLIMLMTTFVSHSLPLKSLFDLTEEFTIELQNDVEEELEEKESKIDHYFDNVFLLTEKLTDLISVKESTDLYCSVEFAISTPPPESV